MRGRKKLPEEKKKIPITVFIEKEIVDTIGAETWEINIKEHVYKEYPKLLKTKTK